MFQFWIHPSHPHSRMFLLSHKSHADGRAQHLPQACPPPEPVSTITPTHCPARARPRPSPLPGTPPRQHHRGGLSTELPPPYHSAVHPPAANRTLDGKSAQYFQITQHFFFILTKSQFLHMVSRASHNQARWNKFLGPWQSFSCLGCPAANQDLGHFCVPANALLEQTCSLPRTPGSQSPDVMANAGPSQPRQGWLYDNQLFSVGLILVYSFCISLQGDCLHGALKFVSSK